MGSINRVEKENYMLNENKYEKVYSEMIEQPELLDGTHIKGLADTVTSAKNLDFASSSMIKPVGWVAHKGSNDTLHAGRLFAFASNQDKKKFGKGVFRLESKGSKVGIIVRLDPKKGRIQFLTPDSYTNDDENFKWDRAFKFRMLKINREFVSEFLKNI